MHPEYAATLTVAADARAAAQQARSNYRAAASSLGQQLRPFGAHAHTPDPAARLADTEQALTGLRSQHNDAHDTRRRLKHDPAILVAPDDVITRERQQWQHERAIERREQARRFDAAAIAAETSRRHVFASRALTDPPSSSPSIGL